MFLIFGILFTILIFGVLIMFFHLAPVFINMPSLLFILVFLLFFMFISKSGKVILMYIKTSFKKEYAYTKTELECISLAMKNSIKYTLASGIFGCITFIIVALANLESKEVLGPALAMSLTSIVYSIAISYFIFFPTQVWADNKILQNL